MSACGGASPGLAGGCSDLTPHCGESSGRCQPTPGGQACSAEWSRPGPTSPEEHLLIQAR
eukprot:6882075-Heterocapsa_arctica.AAC.1